MTDVATTTASKPTFKFNTFTAFDLERAKDKLPAHYVAILRLSIATTPYDEMAEQLHIANGTVKSRLNRARQALAKALAPVAS